MSEMIIKKPTKKHGARLALKLAVLPFLLVCVFSPSAFAFTFDEDSFVSEMLWQRARIAQNPYRPKVALVLGGGGGRGFAHIGVLKLFEEEEIPVDIVIGTSIGALAGAFFTAGVPMSQAADLSREMSWGQLANTNVFSLARLLLAGRLLNNDRMERFLDKHLGQKTFDQLRIPLICIATDINTGERVLLREGSVAFAARASATVPGFFEPVAYRQRMLVDGGLIENVPVNVANIFGADLIIAVPISPDIPGHEVSNVFTMLIQSIYIQGRAFDAQNLSLADIIIRPDVAAISAVDLSQAQQAIELGYDAARRSIMQIRSAIIQKTDEKYLFE